MNSSASGSPLRRHLPAIVALLAGAAVSLLLFTQARQAERRRMQLEFDSQGNAIENTVNSLIAGHVEAMHAIAGFYAASKEIDRQEFSQFTQRAQREYPGIRALAWTPRIATADIAAHEAAAVATYKAEQGYRVRSATNPAASQPDAPQYVFPVLFAEPAARNGSLPGADLGAIAACRPAIDRATDRGVIGATGPVHIDGAAFDSLLLFPIYLKGAPTNNNGQRRQNLEGFAVGMLSFDEMLSAGLRSIDLRGQLVRFLDDTTELYRSPTPPGDSRPPSSAIEPWQRRISIGNRTWVLQGEPTRAYLATQSHRGPWLALAAGALCTLLAASYLHSLTGRAERTRQLVDQRTAELRQSETRHRAVVEQAAEGITIVDAETLRILDVNQAFTRLVGYSHDELIGKPIADLIVDTPQGIAARAQQTLGGGPNTVQRQYRRKDGGVIDVEKSATVIQMGEKKVMCTVIHDITERLRAQQLLEEKNRQLEHSITAERDAMTRMTEAQNALVQAEKLAGLGQMVAGVAHEINNPLSFVANNVAVIERDARAIGEILKLYTSADPLIAQQNPALSAEVADLAERIDLAYTLGNFNELTSRSREGLRRIQQIVKDLRDFARLDQGDQQDVDLNAGIESTVNIIAGRGKKKRVEIIKELGKLPTITCHAAKINQVIMNLLANAIDASNEGGKVTITTAASNGEINISVADTGKGIDAAVRAHIFDPFFTTKPIGEGTGLGLSISYGIIKDHGGRIEVESEVGKGARFRVVLPVVAKDQAG